MVCSSIDVKPLWLERFVTASPIVLGADRAGADRTGSELPKRDDGPDCAKDPRMEDPADGAAVNLADDDMGTCLDGGAPRGDEPDCCWGGGGGGGSSSRGADLGVVTLERARCGFWATAAPNALPLVFFGCELFLFAASMLALKLDMVEW